MKKFSVLLVILLLATPLLAYGLTVDRDEGGIPLQTVFYSRKAKDGIEKTPVKLLEMQEETGEPGEEDHPPMEDPFFPEPDGFKGMVVEINTTDHFIIISNVHYYNNYTKQHTTADTFKLFYNNQTAFIIHGERQNDVNLIVIGERITAIGDQPDYEKNILHNTGIIYQGSIYTPEMIEVPTSFPFVGEIRSIDRPNKKMTVFCFELAKEISVSIEEGTCFQKRQMNNEGKNEFVVIETEDIPAEIQQQQICEFVGLMYYETHDVIAHSVIIVPENN
ncbi:MAG: hypothetical protein PHI40_02065 [Caldisericia bacterium]|nr:hypothetical protein [Caldisericia bacterium]